MDTSLERGLADSAAGRVRDAGDFTQYVDEEEELVPPRRPQRWSRSAKEKGIA